MVELWSRLRRGGLCVALIVCAGTVPSLAEPLPEKAAKVFEAIEKITGREAEFDGAGPCSNPKFCQVWVGPTTVQVAGLGNVTVYSSSLMSEKDYMSLCVAAYSGLAGVGEQESRQTMAFAFGAVAAAGEFSKWFGKTQVRVDSTSAGPECQFFRK